MRKLRFDLNKHLVMKDEEQKVALPVEMELNEQELTTVTGGWGGCGSDSDEWCPPPPPLGRPHGSR